MLNEEAMVHFLFLEKPTRAQIDRITSLYKNAGWWTDPGTNRDLVVRIVAGSHCFAIALMNGDIVGMGRAISDGVSDAYIQDVTVEKGLRNRGIGLQLVREIVKRLEQDSLGWIGLIAERGSSPFYEKVGFKIMPRSTPMVKKQS